MIRTVLALGVALILVAGCSDVPDSNPKLAPGTKVDPNIKPLQVDTTGEKRTLKDK